MVLDTKDLETILDVFNTKTKDLLLQISTETNMEDEHFATVTSETIKNSFDSSVRALQIYKQNELVEQQILAEQIKNGGLHFTYTYYVSTDAEVVAGTKKVGDVKTKTLATGTTKSIYELEMETEKNRANGFIDNLRIKRAEQLSNTIFGLGAGGLKPNASLWGQFFTSINDITAQSTTSLATTGVGVE